MSKATNAPAPEFEEGKITVVVRCRPFNERERSMRSVPCLDFNADGQTMQIFERGVPGPSNLEGDKGRNHTFTFDKSYNQQVPQETVYNDVGKPVLGLSMKGYNTCIFAYGQTGSGKSFAMMGPGGGRDSNKAPGIIPRLSSDLFEEVNRRLLVNKESIDEAKAEGAEEHMLPPALSITVEVSYLEIYQEKVKCLLDPKKDNLKVRQHPALGVYVDQLTEVAVHSNDKVMDLIDGGNNSRHVAATNMNDRSSRSHAIFAITVTQKRTSKTKEGLESVTELKAKINLVDLAGSERAKSTGAEGDTLREGAQINRSLTVLGLVISGLAEQSKGTTGGKAPFIPYRDSMLTYLLKESLGGNSKTYMLSTLSPAHVNYEETLSTLRYADRAKAIVTKACINESAGDKKIRELEDEVSQLREKIREFQQKMEKQEEVAKVVPKLNLTAVSSGQAVRGRASLAMAAVRGREGAAGRGQLALVTPRSAINRVITRDEESRACDENDDDEDPSPRAAVDVARLEERLHLAESLMEKLTETDEHKELEANHIIEEIRQHKTVKASRLDPHILNLDGDLVSDFIVEYLVDEVTYLGTADLDEPVLNARCIVITGESTEGVGAQHCCFVRTQDGRVLLRPQTGCDTFIGTDDTPIDGDYVLTNGTIVCLGEHMLQFKFVDPAVSVPLTGRRRATIVNTSQSQSRQRASPSLPLVAPLPVVDRGTIKRDASPGSRQPTPTPPSDYDGETPPLTPPAPVVLDEPQRPIGVPKLNLQMKMGATAGNARSLPPPQDSTDDEEVDEKSPSPSKPAGIPQLALPPRPVIPQLNTAGIAANSIGTNSNVVASTSSTFRDPSSSTARNSIQSIGTTRPQGVSTARGTSSRIAPIAGVTTTPGVGVVAFNEEVQACFRHTFLFLGKSGSGKSAFRASIAQKDKWYSFFKKETVHVQPTFGVEVSKLETGSLQKVELSLVELSGRESFSTLQCLLPERRVTYILCFRIGCEEEPVSLATFRNYLEFILCQSASSETTVMLIGTHRDAYGSGSHEDRKLIDLLNDLELQIKTFFELLQTLPERRPRIVAKFAVDNNARTVLSGSSKISKFPELLQFMGDHAIHRCRSDFDFPNCLIPTRLLTLSRKLLESRAQGKWCLPSTEYKCIAKQIDQRYERSLEELHRHTQLLHSWGILHHHYRHLLLKKTVILDTTWVMQLIAVVSCCVPGGGTSPHSAGVTDKERLPLILSRDMDCFNDRIPFQLKDVAKVDPYGLCGKGVLSVAAATEMLRLLLREKNYTVRNMDGIMELLENYDLLMKGSKLKLSAASSLTSSGSPARASSNNSFSSEEIGADAGANETDAPQLFYLMPSCFAQQTPSAVTIQLPKLLMGPSYRFSLNMIPPHFFARFVARVSRYALRIYLGPVSNIRIGPQAAEATVNDQGMSGGEFWYDSAWIISSPTSRAFARMVHHSLFITFHDTTQDEEFHDGLRQVVTCLVSESPGAQCEEAILCRTALDCTEEDCVWKATDENINSLEKIRERESMALKSARGGAGRGGIAELMRRKESGEDQSLLDDENGPIPFVRPLDDVLDDVEALERIGRECLVTDEVMHKVEKALKLIHRGQTMPDRDRGSAIEARGMDSLVDALALA